MENSQNKYFLPIRNEDYVCAISDSRAHFGALENAIDFPLSIGTEILAAKTGKVISVKDDSNEGGYDEKYMKSPTKYLNVIAIKHPN